MTLPFNTFCVADGDACYDLPTTRFRCSDTDYSFVIVLFWYAVLC